MTYSSRWFFTACLVTAVSLVTSSVHAQYVGDGSGVMTNQVIHTTGSNPGNNTGNWQSIWDEIDGGGGPTGALGSGNWNVVAHAIDTENYFDYAGGGWTNSPTLNTNSINSNGPGGGGGPISNGNDYSVRAQTLLEFTTAGAYTIGMASDDGRTIKLTEAEAGSAPGYTGFTSATGQGPEFSGAGDTEIGFSGGTGHQSTRGVFDVAAGDILALDAFYYEGGGGDSGEIAIIAGAVHGTGNFIGQGFEILKDGALNGSVLLHTTATAPAVPEPASIAIWSLLGLTLAGYGYRRRRRNS